MHIFISLILVILAGCTRSSGILKVGPDTYTTWAAASPVRGGAAEARRIVLSEANEYCEQLGKEILVTNLGTSLQAAGQSELTFRCLSKGDLGLQRPEFRQTPDVTIEDRRK